MIGELAFIYRRQWRRWGETVGEAPEARQIVVAETIFVLFSVTGVGNYKTLQWVTQKTCESMARMTTGPGGTQQTRFQNAKHT